ncbi:hypothetical protein KVT40_008225 [Elsinoe batatas]|uniref:Uncharacterized protein n=1 Tax=Elsinoe batatas TaxID=2601811 RepID=A0A8K0PF63_9PEZI|nr:hypothetical protein KVT40_008225 [Elsinoe batatas]
MQVDMLANLGRFGDAPLVSQHVDHRSLEYNRRTTIAARTQEARSLASFAILANSPNIPKMTRRSSHFTVRGYVRKSWIRGLQWLNTIAKHIKPLPRSRMVRSRTHRAEDIIWAVPYKCISGDGPASPQAHQPLYTIPNLSFQCQGERTSSEISLCGSPLEIRHHVLM